MACGVFVELFARRQQQSALKFLPPPCFRRGLSRDHSILFRPGHGFRLYGNIFAGRDDARTMARMPRIGWLVQIPSYFLSSSSFVQALVFMLLTAVFTFLICQPRERDSSHDRKHPRRARGAWRGTRRR
jgi:F-type H+-transporting ATPase subunit a